MSNSNDGFGNGVVNVAAAPEPASTPVMGAAPQTTTTGSVRSEKHSHDVKPAPQLTTIQLMSRHGNFGYSLTTEGEAFISTLRDHLQGKASNVDIINKTDCIPLPTSGSFAFVADGKAYVLIMEELASRHESLNVRFMNPVTNMMEYRTEPVCKVILAASEELKNRAPHVAGIVGYHIVTPEDYGRVKQNANHIDKSLWAWDKNNVVNFSVFDNSRTGGSKVTYRVRPDINLTKKFFNDVSPHAVPARMDMGFLCQMIANDGDKNNTYDFAAVGAYVEFVPQVDNRWHGWNGPAAPRQATQFIPIVHISDVAISTYHIDLMAIIQTMTANYLLTAWPQRYRMADTKVNITNLTVNDDGTMYVGEKNEIDMYISRMFTPPLLAIDVVEGRASIPGMSHYITHPGDQTQRLFNFVGAQVDPSVSIVSQHHLEFGGYVSTGNGTLMDTRECDFLNTAARTNLDPAQADLLRYPTTDPWARAKVINDIYLDFRNLWIVNTAYIAARPLLDLRNFVMSKINLNEQGIQNHFGHRTLSGLQSDIDVMYSGLHYPGGGGAGYNTALYNNLFISR